MTGTSAAYAGPAVDAAARSEASSAWRVVVRGVVQGVGFRPFVHRLAQRLALGGWVRNASDAVEIALFGPESSVHALVDALRNEAPPLARIDTVLLEAHAMDDGTPADFRIVASRVRASGDARLLISPDVATCAACERELLDPTNRRADYPFITCTDCGPRHSVILDMPYDRQRTTMREFTQCAECAAEYADIGSRRYHSETNSCAACGPRLTLLAPDGRTMATEDALRDAASILCAGGIVAVRGIGGFHLAVDATSQAAVTRLRERKHRDGKPLAVMVRSLTEAREVAHVSEREAFWLASPERPILVLEAREDSPLAPSVSGGLATVGIMLAYSPLHMLLLDAVRRPLVMTSGNPARLPLAVTLAEAQATLGRIADAFLTHDREIAAPIDDSVARVVDGRLVLLRRARGFAPLPVSLPIPAQVPILAAGAHLKNTFTVANGSDAFVSQHIGDLETLETAQHWNRSRKALCQMVRVTPVIGAHDMHPEYLSTALIARLRLHTSMAVQHHHAHVAAVAAEHGITEPVLGLAFDGTGYGPDDAVWGSEFLIADLVTYRRAAHLRYAPLPGSDAAARDGWRAAVGYASIADVRDAQAITAALTAALTAAGDSAARVADVTALRVARQQCEHALNAPRSSSMGRLFDAAAAILGVCTRSRYEGEAAMRLESLATGCGALPLPIPIIRVADCWELDPVPLLAYLARRVRAGDDAAQLASAFHESVAATSAECARRIAAEHRLTTVALGGGVFQNARLLSSLSARLHAAGLRVLTATRLPPNDGGISYGQAAVAAARLALDDEVF